MIGSTIDSFWDEVILFHRKFHNIPMLGESYDQFLDAAIAAMKEEFKEFVEAAEHSSNLDHALEEAADLLFTMVGVMLALRADPDEFQAALRKVMLKNSGKTWKTHDKDPETGKVTRRKVHDGD